jgi:hypothetical protein
MSFSNEEMRKECYFLFEELMLSQYNTQTMMPRKIFLTKFLPLPN